jgi:ubiquinone/menaquinone biosynthesis C-methylase UbiE
VKSPPEFDEHAETYADAVEASVRMTGGDVQHFATRKVDVFRDVNVGIPRRILDFGCGIGILSRAFADAYPTATVLGVDTSSASVTHATALTPSVSHGRIEFLAIDGAALPLPTGSVDLVTAACVFHHIPPSERRVWFSELLRVLAPGGYCAIFEHNPRNPLTRRAVWRCPFDSDAVLLAPKESVLRMRQAGFAETKIIHYLFLPPSLYGFRRIEKSLRRLPIGGQYLALGRAPV